MFSANSFTCYYSIPPVCPLSFPDTSKVAKECGGTMKNSTACCKAMLTYVAHLQKQSFITNLQALNCASFLGAKLQKMNVSMNVYSSCQITLKDFSLQGKLFKNYQLIMHKGHIYLLALHFLATELMKYLFTFSTVVFEWLAPTGFANSWISR